jgi:hypothetical protein
MNIRIAGALLLGLIALTACGGDSNDSDSDGSAVGIWHVRTIAGVDAELPLRRVPFCEATGLGDSICTVSGFLRFDADGSGASSIMRRVITRADGDRLETVVADTSGFSWVQTGNEIVLDDDPEAEGILRIEHGILNFYFDHDGDDAYDYQLASFARR